MANFEKLQKEASEVGFWSIRMCCSVTRRSNFMIMGLGYLTLFFLSHSIYKWIFFFTTFCILMDGKFYFCSESLNLVVL